MPDPSLILAAAAPGAPSGATAFLLQVFPFLLIFVIFYFLLIRPQQKKVREHQAMISAVKKGDEVITAGGIRARVTRVIDEREVEVEIAQGVKVRVVRSTLTQVLNQAPKGAND
ncbi:preprotein translocase subunit YajC [Sphingomonas humi]|uniref:Sec translocon accessory complex subunit YajC n=1 Tax=Sphingomonas humi TaxID=335630 RepID=A0ABP7RRL3_9SPHN